eukprot:CAMPEP_0195306956 /NCGR_PEP_ID=MMETSP0707-20130614/37467_1 /TAXON_ID=33640 /ORGANISM="Asterionellopsis glacialis, Strain CCMP134" /LENGTH=189 /DNA_ID=CAMNT_0040371189 /DNA_START=51 /DNA_END=620 /DNA_ORIENTATION=+
MPADTQNCSLTLVRPWTHHALVELLKNAMASVVQKAADDGSHYPSPIRVILRQNDGDDNDEQGRGKIHIDIIDQGVGLRAGSDSRKVAFGFAQSSSLKRWDRLDEQWTYAMVRSPLQSLGVGLPLSRMMMQHFGGNVQLLTNYHDNLEDSENMDGNTHTSNGSKGCTASLTLLRDDEFKENQTIPGLET